MKRSSQKVPDVRASLTDRMMLRLSSGKRVDGLWVGTYYQTKAEPTLRRVEEALGLIKKYDRLRYNRIIKDLERVWVRLLPGALGKYTHSLRACELDERFVLADTSPPEVIAATIVHEATHARLWRCGIGYDESLRHRVEAVCCRREVAFASKLPNGERVREKVQDYLAISPTAWTNAATRDRDLEGSVQDLRHIGTPDWLVRTLLWLRARRASKTSSRKTE